MWEIPELIQLVLIPTALYQLWQALKKIKAIGENNQYIPIASIISGAVITWLWAVVQAWAEGGICIPACQLEAVLQGCVLGGAAVGLYELRKP